MMVLFFAAVTLLVQIGKEFQPTGVLMVGRIWSLTAERQISARSFKSIWNKMLSTVTQAVNQGTS